MLPKGDLPYKFLIDKDLYLVVNKSDLIKALHDKFKLILAPEDIKIIDDGTRLLLSLGVHNQVLATLTFKQINDYLTTDGIKAIKYDDQIYKIWLTCDEDYLFVDSGDDRLAMAPAGVDAPGGTIQVDLGEGKVYTLLHIRDVKKINEALSACMALVGQNLETTSKGSWHKVTDNRIQLLRQKFGIISRYNDYISGSAPKMRKIIAHV